MPSTPRLMTQSQRAAAPSPSITTFDSATFAHQEDTQDQSLRLSTTQETSFIRVRAPPSSSTVPPLLLHPSSSTIKAADQHQRRPAQSPPTSTTEIAFSFHTRRATVLHERIPTQPARATS